MLTTKLFESADELLDFVNRGNVLRKDLVKIEEIGERQFREFRLWFFDDHVKPPKLPKLPKPPKPPRQPKPCAYNEAILCDTRADCTGCGWKPKTKDVLPDREPTLEEIT